MTAKLVHGALGSGALIAALLQVNPAAAQFFTSAGGGAFVSCASGAGSAASRVSRHGATMTTAIAPTTHATWLDGCLGEGLAAALAADEALTHTEPRVCYAQRVP